MPTMTAMPETTIGPGAADPVRAGGGIVEIGVVAGRSVVTRDRAAAPLKLLCPARGGPAAWVYTSSYGGGLVAGDRIDLSLGIGPDATGVLTTQASTKVYHRQDGLHAAQSLDVSVADDAVLIAAPDPITCYADADYRQTQRFGLAPGGALVLIDWLTCGRAAMAAGDGAEGGERWAFHRYASRNDIVIDGRLVARDATELCEDDGPLDDPFRTGGVHCLATVMIAGDRFAAECDAIAERINALPIGDGDVLCSTSRLAWGAALRVAGESTERVAYWLADTLAFVGPLIGGGLWDRKW